MQQTWALWEKMLFQVWHEGLEEAPSGAWKEAMAGLKLCPS